MKKSIVLFVLAAMMVLPSVAYAHAQTIDFRCIFQYCHDRFYALAGVTMYDPATADWTAEGGVGILDADEFTLLSLIFANPVAPYHDDIHNAFLQNSARARVVIGSTIIGLTTSAAILGPTARQLIPGSSPAAYYAVDGLMGAYLTLGEWNVYDTTMAGFKDSPFGTAVQWTTDTGQNDHKKPEYDLAHAGLLSMCGDFDGDGRKNCYEYWAATPFSYAGAIDSGVTEATMVWNVWSCLDENNSGVRFFYNTTTHRVYTKSKVPMTFADAKLMTGITWPGCSTIPMRMATIRNVDENNFVKTLANGDSCWVGATDEAAEGTWAWLSGEPFTYTNWDTGQPDNYGDNQNYLVFSDNGAWYDSADNTIRYAVFESTRTLSDVDANGAPDDLEDKNHDLVPDGFCWISLHGDAEFQADVTSGNMPLTVHFTDLSDGNGETITAWAWNFGDGATSDLPNPSHTYMADDPSSTYTVSLTITTVNGSDTITKTNYITVNYVCGFSGQITSQGAMFAEMLLAPEPLSGDLKTLLAAFGQTSWPLFDWEGMEANFPPGAPAIMPGDGLPDEAQMALIERVACRTWLDANELTFTGLTTNKALFLEDVAALAAIEPDFAALGLFADYFAAMIGSSQAMKNTVNALILALAGGATGLPSYPSYVVFDGWRDDLFSADGDVDGDWVTNLDEYQTVITGGGDINMFVSCATDPWCPWLPPPTLPAAGILGLGLLAGSMLAGAALAIRKN